MTSSHGANSYISSEPIAMIAVPAITHSSLSRKRTMTAHTSMLRRLPHAMPRTALAACTCVLAIAATVNIGVDWAIDDSEWARYLCCGLVLSLIHI